jgi:hypothetical protein
LLSDSIDKDGLKPGDLKMDFLNRYKKDGKTVIDEKEIYKRFFHGPKYQVHGGVIKIDDNAIYGIANPKNGKGGSHFSFVKKTDFVADPMAIEASFQNAGLYAMARENRMSLPDGIKELSFIKIPSDIKDLYVRAKYIGTSDMKDEYDTEVIDSQGNIYSVMKGYKMIHTGDLKEDERF